MSDSTPVVRLGHDLLGLYGVIGQSVTYVTDNGDIRKYWPHRYLQAVRRHIEEGDLVAWCEEMVSERELSKGFGILAAAGRLDLTVEAVVADPTRPYHSLFRTEAVAAARARLADGGYEPPKSQDEPAVPGDSPEIVPTTPASGRVLPVSVGGIQVGSIDLDALTAALGLRAS